MAGIDSLMTPSSAPGPATASGPAPGPAPAATPTGGDPLAELEAVLRSVPDGALSAMQGLQQDLMDLEAEELAGLSDLLTFMQANPDQYDATLAELIAEDVIEPGDLPAEYDARYIALLDGLVQSVMQRIEQPAFAQGGHVEGGLASLAAMGRGADSQLAHVTPGEAYLLRSRGGRGTINPATGLPEYGFGLKSLVKGVKKGFKKIGKVLKKAAPIVLPIAMSMIPGVGPILGAALGSGLATAINGGSLKDSLKSAAMGGLAGGAFAGAQGVMSGQGFMAGLKGGLPAAMQPAAALSAAAQPAAGGLETLDLSALPGKVAEGSTIAAQRAAEGLALPSVSQQALQPIDTGPRQVIPEGGTIAGGAPDAGFMQQAKDMYGRFLSPSRGVTTAESILAEQGLTPAQATQAQIAQATAAAKATAQPGMLSRYGPMAALGLGAAYAGGMFEQPDLQAPGLFDTTTGFDLYAQDPGAYSGFSQGSPNQGYTPSPVPPPQYTQAGVGVAPRPGIPSLAGRFQQGYAAGGGVQRYRGPVDGPGHETSDDIPAWLSDGEFVLTAQAVRGAGGGDRQRGVQTLYELMNRLEASA